MSIVKPCNDVSHRQLGFLAIAYSSGALLVLDMRQANVIFRDDVDQKAQKRIPVSIHLHNSEDEKRIVSLKWFVCGFGDGKHEDESVP